MEAKVRAEHEALIAENKRKEEDDDPDVPPPPPPKEINEDILGTELMNVPNLFFCF